VLLASGAVLAVVAGGRAAAAAPVALLALLGAAMGLQNAAVRRLAVPDVTTTVLTLTLTGIAADSSLAGGANPRLGRRAAAVALMLGGALVGAAVLARGLVWCVAAAALGVAVALAASRRAPCPAVRRASRASAAARP